MTQTSKLPFTPFSTFTLRTPIFPLHIYENVCRDDRIDAKEIDYLVEHPIVQEAIYIASPPLYTEWERSKTETLSHKKQQRLYISMLKYLSRMASRCTPFGLFAGCATGTWGESTEFNLKPVNEYIRKTRLDMEYLVPFIQQIERHPEVAPHLKWYSNTTLYPAGLHFRYVEYTIKKNRRHYSIEAIGRPEYVETILDSAQEGLTIDELAHLLVNDEITEVDATYFIEELIANQILVSDLQPTVTGKDYLEFTIKKLESISCATEVLQTMRTLKKQCEKLDHHTGQHTDPYLKTKEFLETVYTTENIPNLFQVDLFTDFEKNTLSATHLHTFRSVISALAQITPRYKNERLEAFKKAFRQRYESEEIPIATALDTEMGIGYLQNLGESGTDSLLEGLYFSNPQESPNTYTWSSWEEMLQKKVREATNENQLQIILTEDDFPNAAPNFKDIPDTLALFTKHVRLNDKSYWIIQSCGGTSAANLMGRFGYGTPELQKLVTEILDKEHSAASDKIHAEIVHLPESRTGNILHREVTRPYEIPYLAQSVLEPEYQLSIDDLLLSVRGDRLILRSKRLDKEVEPHLTNAHAYTNNALPIYHLLCDLQQQDKQKSLYFGWGGLYPQLSFFPRVVYKNCILAVAQWKFKKEVWKPWHSVQDKPEQLLETVTKWKQQYMLPDRIIWSDGDRNLLVHLHNYESVLMLLQSIRNRNEIVLSEFLSDESQPLVSDKRGAFMHEFIIPFYKNE